MPPNLARQIGEEPRTVQLRQAVVTAVVGGQAGGTLTIKLGNGDPIAGVRALASSSVANGATVWVLQQGYDLLVLGPVAQTGWGTTTHLEGLELYHPSSTPYVDFHRAANPAGDANADYNVRLINDAAGWLHLVGAGGLYADGQVDAGQAKIGTHPVHGSYAWFGHESMTSATQYGFLQDASGNTIVNSTSVVWIRRNGVANTNELRLDASGLYVTDDIAIPTDRAIYFKGAWDGTHTIHHSSADDGFRYNTWNYHRWFTNGGEVARLQASDGFYCFKGWLRSYPGWGYYQQDCWFGLKALGNGTRTSITENNETRLVMEKVSQGGWGSAAFESKGASYSVPMYTWHANGERANLLRKDNGGWNGVWIDQNNNCASFFAAGFGACSDEARKTDISVLEGVGLKTIRGLVPKTYRYHPVTEDQIWATEKDRAERAEGKWPFRVGQQESWEQLHVGYMAEEVYNRFPLAAYLDPIDGRPWAIDYGRLTIAAISAINELAERVEDLEARLEVRHAA